MSLSCCVGQTRSASAVAINEQIKVDRQNANYEVKLLLLGPGDSGKSTFAKQMKILYQGGFTEEELDAARTLIRQRTLYSMHALIRASKVMKIRLGHRLRPAVDKVLEATKLTKDILPEMQLLWKSKPIKQVFSRQNEFQIDTNASYYLDSVERLCKEDYVPTNDDVLQARQKTSGILETCLVIDSMQITFVDVGGQRSERRKWLHCFENVTAVIYFINLGEFDLTLSEDYRVNRLGESLDLFEEISTSNFFAETDFFLIYNKDDKFREKVKSKAFQKHFPEYEGSGDYDSCLKFIQKLFEEKCGLQSTDQIHPFVTVSLNPESISQTVAKVKEILQKRLEEFF